MSKIKTVKGDYGGQAFFFCPGCENVHCVNTSGPRWTYNNNVDKPTFSPSILVTTRWSQNIEPGDNPDEYKDEICHSFINDGMIQFLGDSTHKLANKTVPLPEWPFANGTYWGVVDEEEQ